MKIKEIFYSLQGEGFWTGTPALFVRFSGCNLSCPFCDTDHRAGIEMTEEDILNHIKGCPAKHVIFTGGEPALQLTESLVDKAHGLGKFLHIETNGSIELPEGITAALDWITVSPKEAPVRIRRIDELKVLFRGEDTDPSVYDDIEVKSPGCRFLQPCDMGDETANHGILRQTIDYIKRHPQWRLSLQTHKILNIP